MDPVRSNNGPRYKHLADEPAPYDTITVDKLTPIIGGEIGGVDLSRPLGNRTLDEIHRALAENLVIFFRDQHLTQDQHLAFGRLFGDLHLHPAAPHEPGKPELMIIHADKDSPRANGEAGPATSPSIPSRRWAAFFTLRNSRRRAATPCSPGWKPP